jgi:hypothetical protein
MVNRDLIVDNRYLTKKAHFVRFLGNFGTIPKFLYIWNDFSFQIFGVPNYSTCGSYLSEVDADLPLALRKNNFKRVS